MLVANSNPNTVIRIMPCGTNDCTLTIGSSGHGVVSNAGVLGFGNMVIARDVGSTGVYVHDGGGNSLPYPKDIAIGKNGVGELIVKSGTVDWKWYVDESQKIG